MTKLFPYWLALATYLFLPSCSNNDPIPLVEESSLVEAKFLDVKTAQEIRLLIELSGRNIDPAIFKYDVNLFRVKYNTMYGDNKVVASGVVILPITNDDVSVLSFQHGTIVEHNEAPSALDENDPELYLLSALASTGYVTIVPDYLGFGESKNLFHPYYVEEATARAVIDNIYAGVELADDEDVNVNQRLFLAGYSQGGYATLATHKAIEENGIEGLQLTGSYPAAGGYDLEEMRGYFFSLEEYHQPFYMAYVARSYQTFFGFNSILTDFFNEPYASRIPDLINGINTQGHINSQLTPNISQLLQSDLRANFLANTKYTYLVNAFKENSLTDWIPTLPIVFYHGSADLTVPYENSVITYEKLLANGTDENLLTFITIPGADHATGVEPYFADLLLRLQLVNN